MITSSIFQDQTKLNKKNIKRVKFTDDEDREIRSLVVQLGTDAWDQVAEAMSSQRTKRQVRERWQNYICPELDPQYTEADDQMLENLYIQMGPQWTKIAVAIGKKSGILTRNRYRLLQSMKTRGIKPDYDSSESGVQFTDSAMRELAEDQWPYDCEELL
jgi:hypothetical protein